MDARVEQIITVCRRLGITLDVNTVQGIIAEFQDLGYRLTEADERELFEAALHDTERLLESL